MRIPKIIKKTVGILSLIIAVTAFFSFLQYYLQVRITPISWKSKAHLILADGTEYEKTIPVEVEGTFYHYNVRRNERIDSIEILATARDHETEIFRGTAVYYAEVWQWVIHDREKTGYGHIDHQAMFTDYGSGNDSTSFLFCIDDVSKITEDGEPGKPGLLVVPKWDTDDVSKEVQNFQEEAGPEALDFLKEYGLCNNDGLSRPEAGRKQ